jgi:hypothetical protein
MGWQIVKPHVISNCQLGYSFGGNAMFSAGFSFNVIYSLRQIPPSGYFLGKMAQSIFQQRTPHELSRRHHRISQHIA